MAWLKGWINIFLDWWTEVQRETAPPPLMWVRRIEGNHYTLQEVTCAAHVLSALVMTGLAESGGEAARLIKAGAIERRLWDCSDAWTKCAIKDMIPHGEPIMLRRGKSFYNVQVVMVPWPQQTLKFWRGMLTGGF